MDFNEKIKRKNTGSIKWDTMEDFDKPINVLPLWVADMDFKAPNGVIKAIEERAAHGVFGYTYLTDSYYESVINWMEHRHNWQIKKEWIVATPGVVPAINFIIQEFTKIGDGVLVQRPVYNPFTDAIINNERKLINSPLVLIDNHYEVDYEDFENKIIENNVKLFVLCSPHNPVGRVWTKEELIKMGDICLKNNCLIVVDEIHHDLVFKGYKHIPFASLGNIYSNSCITCTAPSKTFNIAGLKIANIIIENKEILDKFYFYLEKMGLKLSNMFGIIGCQAAYNTGKKWLDDLLNYLEENKKYVQNYLVEKLPMIHVLDNEATYLLWLDFRELGMNSDELEMFLLHKANLWLNTGNVYGTEGEGFVRMNIACPRVILEQAMTQLEKAINCNDN